MVGEYQQTEVGVIPVDWGLHNLNELSYTIIDGTHHTPKYRNQGIPFLRVTDIQNESIDFSNLKFISTDEHLYLIQRCNPEKGDLLLSKNGTIGIPKLIDWDWTFSIFVSLCLIKVKSDLLDVNLLEQLFKSDLFKLQLKQLSKQGTVTNLHLEDIRKLVFPLPPTKAEQTAIATVLSDTDALIAQLEKLIAKKKAIKQGAMQELLRPKEGWVEKKLGEVLKIRHGKSQKHIVVENGSYPILASGGIIGWTNSFLYNKPSVLIGRKGTIDQPQYMELPFWSVDTLFYTEISTEHVPKYIYYMFVLIDWYAYNEASGVPSLNAKTIEGIEKFFPDDINEEIKISTILTNMDSEIEVLRLKLEKIRMIKQSMMQVLLTGKVRLI